MSVADTTTERRARRFWTLIILGLLASQLSIGVLAIYLAHSDPSLAVVPNYYERALKWDEIVAARQASDALGWRVNVQVASDLDASGVRAITLVITDQAGEPVRAAHGTVRMFHHSRANDVQELNVDELSSGVYRIPASMPKAGLWQFELSLKRAENEQFLFDRVLNLSPTGVSIEESAT